MFFVDNPKGLAFDVERDKLYWASSDLDGIFVSRLDGSGAGFIVQNLNQPRAVALDLRLPADVDCDGDQLCDSCEIEADPSLDTNGNGVLDSCEDLCRSDIASDGLTGPDGTVDVFDLLILLDQWGTAGPEGDIAGDGTATPDGIVDLFDLLFMLAEWGEC